MDIEKGRISSFEGEMAKVVVTEREDYVTKPLVIPWFLKKDHWGELEIGDEVVFAEFNDYSGIILSRFDTKGGAKSHQTITIEGDCITEQGSHIAKGGDCTADEISLKEHTHPETGTITEKPIGS